MKKLTQLELIKILEDNKELLCLAVLRTEEISTVYDPEEISIFANGPFVQITIEE